MLYEVQYQEGFPTRGRHPWKETTGRTARQVAMTAIAKGRVAAKTMFRFIITQGGRK